MDGRAVQMLLDKRCVQPLLVPLRLPLLLSLVRTPVHDHDVRAVKGLHIHPPVRVLCGGVCVLRVVGVHARLPVLRGDEAHVVVEREDLCFGVQMQGVGVLRVPCGASQCSVLDALQHFDAAGGAGSPRPRRTCI